VSVEYVGPQFLNDVFQQYKVKSLNRAVHVWLTGKGYNDSVVPAICQLKSLRHLELQSTTISPAGLFRIRQALPACTITDNTPVDARLASR